MAKKIRKSQEEEVVEMLKRECFRELSKSGIKKEPYKSINKITNSGRVVPKTKTTILFSQPPRQLNLTNTGESGL
jgi:hypothetical protein